MTSPRPTYGSGYYSAPSFPDTPIYDSLVAERGTPQIAPIRVPSLYEPSGSSLPALPPALPALPAAPAPVPPPPPAYYGQPPQQPMAPLPPAPQPYIPQQPAPQRGGYPGVPQQGGYRPAPQPATGYETMRPTAPRPQQPAPAPYQDPYQSGPYRPY
ncbi:DUF6643 family protein [Streptomyces sp. NPDC047046]|uniref:DUF6643 family protein n=1 Tax=Streptomyces sp. NPDC047046 TaxID=3155378 RepID=UPI0033D71BDB